MQCKEKELGWVLSIDQASNQAGVSLWKSGQLVAVTVLKSRSKNDKMSRRLQDQVPQLTAFLDQHLPENETIKTLLFEGVRARLVLITVGAFLTCPRLNASLSARGNFVESRQWKSWARMHGAHSQPFSEIKGVTALREIRELSEYHWIDQEDIADSVLIYKCWAGRK